MSRFIHIYEVNRNTNQRDQFRVPLPRSMSRLDSQIFNAVAGRHTFVRELAAINDEVDTVPNIRISIADAVEAAMQAEPQKDMSVIPEFKADETLDDECSICMNPIKKGDSFRALPCSDVHNHKFHTACIDPWLASNSTCPNCRTNIFQ